MAHVGRRCSGLGFLPLQRMVLCTVAVANGFHPTRAQKTKINPPRKGVELEAAGNAGIFLLLYTIVLIQHAVLSSHM